jgi:hypothetical protein
VPGNHLGLGFFQVLITLVRAGERGGLRRNDRSALLADPFGQERREAVFLVTFL